MVSNGERTVLCAVLFADLQHPWRRICYCDAIPSVPLQLNGICVDEPESGQQVWRRVYQSDWSAIGSGFGSCKLIETKTVLQLQII
jgi:hypothetical protein